MAQISIKSNEIAAIIDHTLLNPWATKEEVIRLCEEANQLKCAAVCVNESRIVDTVSALKKLKSKVKVCCVIGFPLGACTTTIKVCSALDAIKNGAEEIDMVINVGFLRENEVERFEDDIKAVMEAIDEYNKANKTNVLLKVILENCYLTDDEIIKATSTIAAFAGEHLDTKVFVKTSTGFGTPQKSPSKKTEIGATIHDIGIMKRAIDDATLNEDRKTYKYIVGIKAAGGIRDRESALNIMKAGGCFDENNKLKKDYREFFRIGASATKEICK
jgi:deoxyribose-phosphate aldolase